jgi:predicted nucleic acid-binding protein
MIYLLDTGPLVGLLNRNDPWSDWCVETLQQLSPPFYSCEAVLAEASHFLEGMEAVCKFLDQGELVLAFEAKSEQRRLCGLMSKYRQMSFADACIVRMAEIHRGSVVWTLDRKDFSVYRMRRREPVPFVAPEAQ